MTFYFTPENRAIYEIMRKNMAQPKRLQMITLRMRFGFWINNVKTHIQNMKYLLLLYGKNGCTNTPQCYVYTYIACLVNYS
jgi:hypothetical protein